MRSTVLDEIIGLDGPGDHLMDHCSSCSDPPSDPLYRCIECSYPSIHCIKCIVERHKTLPLHRLEVRQHRISQIVELTISPALEEWVLRPDLPPLARLRMQPWPQR